MTVGRPLVGTIDVGCLDMPCTTPWLKKCIGPLVASGGAGALGHGEDSVGTVLCLDGHGGDGAVESGVGRGGATGGVGGGPGALCTRTPALGGGGHVGVEGGELLHHPLVLVLLVCVDGLGMLAEVVEAGELLRAVAGEWPLAGMLSGKSRGVGERHGRRDAGGSEGGKRRVGSSTAGKRGEDGMEKEGVRT